MLSILGNPKRLCGGLTRRDWIRVGALGLSGITLPQLTALQRASAPSVAAVRETSVVITALFAWLILREHVRPERLAGAGLVAGGVALLSLT